MPNRRPELRVWVERVTGIEQAWPAWKVGSVSAGQPRGVTRDRAKQGDDGVGNLGVADVGSLLVQQTRRRGRGGVNGCSGCSPIRHNESRCLRCKTCAAVDLDP